MPKAQYIFCSLVYLHYNWCLKPEKCTILIRVSTPVDSIISASSSVSAFNAIEKSAESYEKYQSSSNSI